MQRRDALGMIGAGVAGLMSAGSRARALAGGALAAQAPMLTRPIPSTGEVVPVIGVGTWQTFDVGTSAAEREPLALVLSRFVAQGGRMIDSSPMYGRSESVVGDLAGQLAIRDKLFIATKVWTTGRAAGIEQMETSLRRLRVDVVDLMQVHNLVDARTHLDTLRGWKREGRIRYLGVTHYTAASLDDVARYVASEALDFVQINYSVGEREADRRLLALARDRGVAVIANRPFAGGDLFRTVRSRPLPSWAGEIDCASWAQLLLKFVVSHPSITCAIPGTSRVDHLEDNLGAGRGRQPDASMRARIAAAATT